jgi:predicted ATPase
MGVVYEAYDRESDSVLAIKALHRLDGHSLYQFKREFRELADLHHPNLLRLGELHCVDNQWFFTMELVKGRDFVRYVRDGRSPSQRAGARGDEPRWIDVAGQPTPALIRAREFDEQKLRDALGQLAQAVHAMHGRGQVHRDIKPSNVLVTDDGRVVLLDFGLMQRFDVDEHAPTTDNSIAGTAAYMAPEQAAPGPVGPAADWYAVGVVLYQALTGMLPFSGQGVQVVLAKQLREAQPTSQLVGDVPADLDALCQALLRCNPAERPSEEEVLRLINAGKAQSLPRQDAEGAPCIEPRRRLVGRERELGLLAGALRACEAGEQVSVLVHGEPGIGKTTAVERFIEDAYAKVPSLVVLRGRCYEQEAVPFNAFDGIVDELSHYLKRLDEVTAAALLPANVQLLASVFPVLRRVPVVSAIGPGRRGIDRPEELRQQAFGALRRLFESLAGRVPLILFVDDLQWADRDSLALLDALLAPPNAPPLLLVATTRSAQAVPGELRVRFGELAIGRLAQDSSQTLLAQLLEEGGAVGSPQMSALVREADGHPLFMQELVRFALTNQPADSKLHLEDVLGARVSGLAEPARRLMEILAIAGVPLKSEVLASVAELPLPQCVRWLRTLRAVQLVRVDGVGAERTVQSFHDRVREATLKLLREARGRDRQLEHVHLSLGRQLLARFDSEQIEDNIFGIVYHFNLALGLIEDPEERAALVNLDLQAGRKAVASTAYEAGLQYFRKAAQLLPENPWIEAYKSTLAIHKEWMVCEHLAGNQERAAELCQLLLDESGSDLDKVEVYLLWIQLITNLGRFGEAIETGRSALRLLGVHLPMHPGRAALLAEHAQVRWFLNGRPPAHLIDLQENENPRIRAANELLTYIVPALFFTDTTLMEVCLARIALYSLKHGLSSASAFGFAGYGTFLSGTLGKYADAYEFGQLSLRVNDRFQDPRLTCKLLFQNGTYLTPWVRPYWEAREQLVQAGKAGLRGGDLAYEAYSAATLAIVTYCEAADLGVMQERGESARDIAASRRDYHMSGIGAALARYCAALRGEAEPQGLSSPELSDADFRASLDEARMPIAVFYYHYLNAELAYAFCEDARAQAFIDEAARLTRSIFSIPTTAEYCLLEVLVAARLHDAAGWAERIGLRRVIARGLKQLAGWARTCPANFESGYFIARAEHARVGGHHDAALKDYECAHQAADQHRQPKRAAQALELAARLEQLRGAHAEATMLARKAIAAYERWGAQAKAAQLRRAFDLCSAPTDGMRM